MRRRHIETCVLSLRLPRCISVLTILVLQTVVSTAQTGGEARPRPAENPVCETGVEKSDDALNRILSSAIRKRGGREKLSSLRDDYSATRIVFQDVHGTEILQRTWTMRPDLFRQDTIQNGILVKSQQYDGKAFLEAYGPRVRFGLEKDLKTLLENLELNRIFSLLPIGSEPYPATLGGRSRQGGRWLREIRVEGPSGLTYRLFLDEETCLVARLEYLERRQYAQGLETHAMVTHIDSYTVVDGVRVADRLRLFSGGVPKAAVRLVEHRFNVGLDADFFSRERLLQDLSASPVMEEKIAPDRRLQCEWKEAAYRKIVERLRTHGGCRFREAASYGDPRRYRERLFESGLTLLVEPNRLGDEDVRAFYAELLPGPSGFHHDCIVLAAPPEDSSVSGDLLLHEMTHALLRRGQEEAPLAIRDDEYFAYFQGSLFGVGSFLESFERIAFRGQQEKGAQAEEQATRLWRAFRRNLHQARTNHRMTDEALDQFREWCGVDFDPERIRHHYLDLGVDPDWLPTAGEVKRKALSSGPPPR